MTSPDQPDELDELGQLDRTISELTSAARAAWQSWSAIDSQLNAALRRRTELLAASAATPAPAAAQAAAATVAATVAAQAATPVEFGSGNGSGTSRTGTPATPAGPETSTRTVQNVLFVLGGLLLATAAIVFTAVAWARYGEAGRAAILGGLTVLALATPLVALRRGLRATAETFTSLGLLLVLLDGYAAWYVDLFGAKSVDGLRYVGLVCLITTLIAVGYRLATTMVAAAVIALLVAQPVIPTLLDPFEYSWAGRSGTVSAVAALNLAVLWWWRRRTDQAAVFVRTTGWIWYAVAVLLAFNLGVLGQFSEETLSSVLQAGLAVSAVGGLLVLGAPLMPSTKAAAVAAGTFTAILAFSSARAAMVAWPSYRPVALTGVIALIAALAASIGPLLAATVRRGPRTGALVAAFAPAVGLALAVLSAAATSVREAMPAWHAGLTVGTVQPRFGSQLLAAVCLIALAIAVSLPRKAYPAVAATTVAALALLVPQALRLPWWSPSIVELGATLLVVAATYAARTARAATLPGLLAAALACHSLLVSLVRPTTTAIVTGGLVAVGAALAFGAAPRLASGAQSDHTQSDHAQGDPTRPARLWLAYGGVVTVMLLWPLTAAATVTALRGARSPHHEWDTVLMIAVGSLLSVLYLLRRARPALTETAYSSFAIAALLWSAVAEIRQPDRGGLYAAVALALYAVAVLVRRSRIGSPAASAASADSAPSSVGMSTAMLVVAVTIQGVVAALAALPSLMVVLGGPYSWLGAIWSGAPDGIGIFPPDVAQDIVVREAAGSGLISRAVSQATNTALALAILGLAAAIAGYAGGRGSRVAVPALIATTTPALPLLAAGQDLRWPATAVVSLVVGWGVALLVALWPSSPTGGWWRWTGGLTAIALIGAGTAGMLATRVSTIAGLGSGVVIASLIAISSRRRVARVAGWLSAGAAAVCTATAAGLAADWRIRDVAFVVLAVSGLALHGSALLRRAAGRRAEDRPAEARPTEGREFVALAAVGHAGAVVALAYTAGFAAHAATACTIWGVLVGTRALWPHTGQRQRIALVGVAGGWELLAWWLLLAHREVTVREAYTLPIAVVALVVGWLALRQRPALRSWVAYGPALAAAFLPSLATILITDDDPWRRLAVGCAALVVVVAGSVRRLQAPVVAGSTVLVLIALHEVVLVWDLLPRWLPLAVGGLILVTLAITYERRRRDITALGVKLRAMR